MRKYYTCDNRNIVALKSGIKCSYRHKRFCIQALVSVGIMLGVLGSMVCLSLLQNTSGHAATSADFLLVRIRNVAPAEAQRLIVQGVDLLEARDGPDLFALITPAQMDMIRSDGWDVQLEQQQTALLQVADTPSFAGYQTVEDIERFMRDRAHRYPHFVTLVDFGDSWKRRQSQGAEGYDLLALRLTNQAITGPKPIFFLMAAIHAREWTTAEIATRFIDYLVQGYNIDPTATWLLNEREIVVVPMVNPDGRKLAELAYLQRKNLNTANNITCTQPPSAINQHGIDLNRNFAFQWNTAGVSADPCSQVYPGVAAASESETQALQSFITTLFPNRPRPANGTPVADDTTGVLISLHSFADLVLWPWGYTYVPAPDAAALERLGRRLASLNGYDPFQSIYLYPTSGTADEWAYAALGIATYTFEIGPLAGECSGFMPPYSCLDGGHYGSFWLRNKPALLYAAQVAYAPYIQPAGPDVDIQSIEVVSSTTTITVNAIVDGRERIVTGAEVSLGVSPEMNDGTIAARPIDGTFDTYKERIQVVVPQQCVSDRRVETMPLVFVRGRNGIDEWGPVSAAWLSPRPTSFQNYRLWLPLIR